MVVEEVWEQGQGGVCAEEGPGWEGKKAESQMPGLVACSRVDPGRTSNYRPSPASEGKWGSFLHTACCTETLSFNETNAKYFCEVKVTQWCLILCDPMDYTVHGVLRAEHWSG